MTKIYSNEPLFKQQQVNKKKQAQSNKGFKDLLQNKLQSSTKLKFSKHAKSRLQSRKINFTKQEASKLQQAVDKAQTKGAQESLVLINDNAYIVSVKNKTVITAMNKDSMQDDVVTNIDSAIVMK